MAYQAGVFQTKEKEYYLIVFNKKNHNVRAQFSDKVELLFRSEKPNICFITLRLSINPQAPLVAYHKFPIQTLVKLPQYDYQKKNIEFDIKIMDITGNNIAGSIYIFSDYIVSS